MTSPRALRIHAGDLVVELQWMDGPTLVPSPPEIVPAEPAGQPTLAADPPPAAATGLVDICAPTVGTFYRAPEPGAAPFVVEGDHVRRGQQLGIVEAMKLMIPLEADRDGHVVAMLAEDGTPVEYGDPLIAFAPAAG